MVCREGSSFALGISTSLKPVFRKRILSRLAKESYINFDFKLLYRIHSSTFGEVFIDNLKNMASLHFVFGYRLMN